MVGVRVRVWAKIIVIVKVKVRFRVWTTAQGKVYC